MFKLAEDAGKTDDGKEVWSYRTPAVGNLIREAKTFMLPGVMQTGKKQGMKLMDDSLMELYDAGLISQEEAYVRAEQKALMRQHFAH